MSTFQPTSPNWLGPGFSIITEAEPELIAAYNMPDYPSEDTGEGDWVDLYLDAAQQHTVGRLWVAPEENSIGLIELPGSNTDHLTRIALQLRDFQYNDVPVMNAWQYITENDGYTNANNGFGMVKDAAVDTAA